MSSINLNSAEFIISAHNAGQWPSDTGREVAFAGRSNVGKSSAINAISGRNGLARTSKTPGRTQQIVFFDIDETTRLVDLPGYGYAKVSEALKKHWRKNLETYLSERTSLKALILPMDARRPLTPLDVQMLEWCQHFQIPVHILLTKADKLTRQYSSKALREVELALSELPEVSVQLFSASKRSGVDEARERVIHFLNT